MDSGRLPSGVENRSIMRRFKGLKKAILKVPRWVVGKLRPKNRRASADERKTDGDEDSNELAATTVDDRDDNADDGHDEWAGAAGADSGDDVSDDQVAAAGSAADLVLVPAEDLEPVPAVDNHRALVKRGYTVGKQINGGSYGSVLLARSKRHHGLMAIKMVEKKTSGTYNSGRLWSIENEKTFAGLFDHPYLNVYHEIIDTSRRTYMVMEYFSGGTLLDYFEEVDHTAEPVAYEWFAQLCSALEYVHGHGFSHRDVKLDNVLLDRRRRIRLADFGCCGATSAARLDEKFCGTPLYMSPELLDHRPYRGQSADVWAAGVLLHCLVTGRFPFPYAEPTHWSDSKVQRVLKSQKEGFAFSPEEKLRLSIECQSILEHIFVEEEDRLEIRDMKKHEWMVKEAQNAKR